MLPNVKKSENALAEQILKGRLVDCGHEVFNSKRQDVTDQQCAALKEECLNVRPISGTEWRCVYAAKASTSLQEDDHDNIFLYIFFHISMSLQKNI